MLATPQGYTTYLPIGGSPSVAMRWADKAVADAIPYTLDCTAWLQDAGADSIVADSVTIEASPNTLTIGTLQATGTTLTWLISGGVVTNPVADYAIIVQFTTLGGLTVNRAIWLRVWPLAPNLTFATDLVVVAGPPGRGIASVANPGGGLSLVFTFTDSTTQTITVPGGVTASQIEAAFTATPALLVNVMNAAYAAGGFPVSNTGSGGGFFLYDSFLSVGTT